MQLVYDASVGLNIDFSGGNNTTSKITLKDNVADALNITEGSNSYIKFVTTDSSEQIVFGKDIARGGTVMTDGQIADDGNFTFDITGDLTVDVDGGDVYYKDAGTTFLHVSFDGTNTTITNG